MRFTWLAAFALAFAVHAQTSPRSYPIGPGGDALVLHVPAGWHETVSKPNPNRPATISYRPRSGARFEVMLSPVLTGAVRLSPLEELRPGMTAMAQAAKRQAVEEVVPLVELLGPQAQGYYFKATDRAPKAGEYKYMAQGMVAIGHLRVAFTVLTNDGQREVVDAAFGMLRNARFGASAPDSPAPSQVARPDPARLQGLLAAGDFERLDSELSAYQDAYRAGAIGDEDAARAFTALVTTDPDLRGQYDKWVAAKPRSYVARVARGYYLARLGYQARGARSAGNTTQAQFEDMGALFKLAMADLEASFALDAKPVLGYGTMIWIAMAAGGGEPAARFLRDAIAIDARVYTARASYLASLRPEWGGSLERMQAALDSWKASLAPAQLARLARMIDDAKWRARLAPAEQLVYAKRYKEAIAQYDAALAEQPVARAFAMRGYSHAQLGDHPKAIADFDRALELDPYGECCSGTRSNRARSHLTTGAVQKGIDDLVVAAENDDEWAQRELAAIYAFGKYGFKRDYVVGRRWCELAAKRGDGLAMYCMGGLYHAGLGVQKDLARAAKWFEVAAGRGIADAQADFGFMLWQGQGVGQDRDLAIKWWRAAARQGNKRAQQQLDGLPYWDRLTKVDIPDWLEKR